MRKAIMPIMAAAFLAVAGTAAIPETANAASVGFHGNGWSVEFNDRNRHGHGYQRHNRSNRHCEPIFRKQRVWTNHGWKRIKVKVGYDCHRGRRWN